MNFIEKWIQKRLLRKILLSGDYVVVPQADMDKIAEVHGGERKYVRLKEVL
jgi:hypothetical protein